MSSRGTKRRASSKGKQPAAKRMKGKAAAYYSTQKGSRSLRSLGSGTIVVRRKEFLLKVQSTGTAYNEQCIPLDPGDEVYGWLRNITQNYEQYKWGYLTFTYVPAVATSVSGTVMMAPEADPTTKDLGSAADLLNSQNAKSTNVYNTLTVRVPTTQLNSRELFYVGTAVDDNESGAEARQISAGCLFIAFDGVPANQGGQLWVSYECALMNPRPDPHPETLFAIFDSGNNPPEGTGFNILGATPQLSVSKPGVGDAQRPCYWLRSTDQGITPLLGGFLRFTTKGRYYVSISCWVEDAVQNCRIATVPGVITSANGSFVREENVVSHSLNTSDATSESHEIATEELIVDVTKAGGYDLYLFAVNGTAVQPFGTADKGASVRRCRICVNGYAGLNEFP